MNFVINKQKETEVIETNDCCLLCGFSKGNNLRIPCGYSGYIDLYGQHHRINWIVLCHDCIRSLKNTIDIKHQ